MARFTLGLLAGLVAVIVCALVLWLVLPFLFSAFSSGPSAWLGWFPFAIFVPALLLGGFAAAKIVAARRTTLGFTVGLVATGLAGFFAQGAGHVGFLFLVLLVGGVLGAIGARFAGKDAIAP